MFLILEGNKFRYIKTEVQKVVK